MGGTLDIFDVMCQQHHRTALNLFLNGTKNGDIGGTCKRSLALEHNPFVLYEKSLHLWTSRNLCCGPF